MKISYPPIRVHVWGGLGSQLYAWAFSIDLGIRFPRRRIVLVLHDGGVTKRKSELHAFLPPDLIEIVHDFNLPSNKVRLLIQKGIRLTLRILGFTRSGNLFSIGTILLPWIVSFRGHYSTRELSIESATHIRARILSLPNIFPDGFVEPDIALHYRLGDLLTLTTKAPLSPELVLAGLSLAQQAIKSELAIAVCSDSPEEAVRRISEGAGCEVYQVALPPLQTIRYLISAKIFVGTPSKISEWVVLLRSLQTHGRLTFLPDQMRNQMNCVLPHSDSISYY